ncbi:MAG TPA: hypothetical protein VMG41_07520 [Gemmatimonadales bacterium]|nr:hypothetical protein [Gemmatimonadales bacterium]
MPRLLRVAVTGFLALIGAGHPMPTSLATPATRMVADPSLRDVAVAVYDPLQPVIYFNPTLMQRFSPELDTFFMAHERAHITLRHTRAGALGADSGIRDRLLQSKELEADCLAAEELGAAHRAASLAAVRFFAHLGTQRLDAEHPPGALRARQILACMPQ